MSLENDRDKTDKNIDGDEKVYPVEKLMVYPVEKLTVRLKL